MKLLMLIFLSKLLQCSKMKIMKTDTNIKTNIKTNINTNLITINHLNSTMLKTNKIKE